MSRLVVMLTFSLIASTSSAARAADLYLSDVPRRFPAAFAAWKKAVPYAVTLPDWLAGFAGVVTPLRDIAVRGTPMVFGTVCMPHDCGDNMAGVMFSRQQDRIVALVRLAGQDGGTTLMFIGAMNNDEYTCIRRAMDDSSVSAC